MVRVGSMSDEEAGAEFQDSAGAEAFAAEAPEAEGGKPGELEPWVTELIGRVGAGASLNTNDKLRVAEIQTRFGWPSISGHGP